MLESSSSTRDDSIGIASGTLTAGSALLEGGDGILASNLAPVGGQISSVPKGFENCALYQYYE